MFNLKISRRVFYNTDWIIADINLIKFLLEEWIRTANFTEVSGGEDFPTFLVDIRLIHFDCEVTVMCAIIVCGRFFFCH